MSVLQLVKCGCETYNATVSGALDKRQVSTTHRYSGNVESCTNIEHVTKECDENVDDDDEKSDGV